MKPLIAHVAACLLVLLWVALPSYAQDNEQPAETSTTIIAVAQQAGTFTTLLQALDAANLTTVLKGDGPFTVFAPTDEAFAKLPAGTVENLLKPENREKLVSLLTYHVVEGQATASDASEKTSAKTLEGNDLAIMMKGDGIMVNQANVVQADVEASNGIIHVIDTVLMPPKDMEKNQ